MQTDIYTHGIIFFSSYKRLQVTKKEPFICSGLPHSMQLQACLFTRDKKGLKLSYTKFYFAGRHEQKIRFKVHFTRYKFSFS